MAKLCRSGVLQRILDLTRRALLHRRVNVLIPALAVALTLPSLCAGWAADDHHQRLRLLGRSPVLGLDDSQWDVFRFTGDAEVNARMMDIGVWPWWTQPDLKAAFFRPLTVATHWLDYKAWPNCPAIMHAQSLIWFAILSVAVLRLYRRMMGPVFGAALAALLYAIDDARAVPAAWLANRNALLAILFGVLALIAHDRWRRDGWKLGALAGPILLLLGLLSKEAGISICGYLFAYALWIDPAKPRSRFGALVPYALVAIIWRITWVNLGYGMSPGMDLYIDPAGEPLRFLGTVLERGPAMLLGQFFIPPSDIYLLLLDQNLTTAFAMVAGGLLLIIGWVMAKRLEWTAETRFWATGMMLAVIPVCAVFSGDRLLGFIGLGAFALLARLFEPLFCESAARPGKRPRWWRPTTKSVVVVLAGIHFVLAPVVLALRSAMPMGPPSLVRSFEINGLFDVDLSGKSVVVVTAPIPMFTGFLAERRALAGKSIPAHTRVLAPYQSESVVVIRTDSNTLVIRPAQGFLAMALDRLARGASNPMERGHQVKLTGMTATITALTEGARPAEVSFRFDVPLEDPSLVWFYWNDGSYARFTPPAVGEQTDLGRLKKGE